MQSITNRTRKHSTTLASQWSGLALLILLWLLTGCTISPPETGDNLAQVSTAEDSATATPPPTSPPALDETCEYAVVVRDSETNAPIGNAKITVEYQLNAFTGHTDSEGRYRGIFLCTEDAPRYQLRIEANDYQTYSAEFTLMEKIEEIYLVSTETRFCPYVIKVLDATSKVPIPDAKVRVEHRLYYAGGYTDDEGYYNSELPCAEELPQIGVAVYADDYDPYSTEYTLQDEIKEIRLTYAATPTPTPMPTPTPTATLFPPRAEGEVLVLVADILVPGCINDPACPADPDDVTQRLVSTMRKNLKSYPEIRIERLRQFIEEEGGSERAMEIGRSPEFDATFVIWGNYLGAPEVYLFFDIMETTLPFFDNSYDQAYGPMQIQQPSMFEFKADLGEQWAYVTAFATGLALYQEGDRHHEAEPLFDTAVQMLDTPANMAVDPEMVRYLYLYRGANYLYLGRANLAEPNLYALYEMLDPEHLAQDELGSITLDHLGITYSDLGDYEKAIEFSEQALAIAREAEDPKAEGNYLSNLGIVYSKLGDYDKAFDLFELALAISREINDRKSESADLGNLGIVYRNLGDYEKAIEFYERALAIAQEIKGRRSESLQLSNLGIVYSKQGDYEKAIEFYERSLAISQEINHRKSEGVLLGNLGIAYRYLGDYEKAIEFYERGLAIAREIKNRNNEGDQLGYLGSAYSDLGEYEKAIEFAEQALAIAREVKDRNNEGNQLGNLGIAYRYLGEYEKSIDFFEQALAISRETKNRSDEGKWLGNLGTAYFSLGSYEKAIKFSELGLAISLEMKDRRSEGVHLGNLGNIYTERGEYGKAISFYSQGLAISREIKERGIEGDLLGNLGYVYSELGDYEKAIELSEQALDIAREIKDRSNEENQLGNLGTIYSDLGEYKQAIEFYKQALVIAREIKDIRGEGIELSNLANAYRDLGEYEKAVEFYKQALDIARETKNRRDEGSHLGNLGSAYLSLGEYDKAIDYLTESYMVLDQIKSPSAALAYRLLKISYDNACWTFSLKREVEIALPYCEEAVKHDPQSWDSRDSRGLAYALLGKIEMAIADFQFAVDGLKALNNPAATPLIEQRQAWIDALTAGENPFTDEVLAALREE